MIRFKNMTEKHQDEFYRLNQVPVEPENWRALSYTKRQSFKKEIEQFEPHGPFKVLKIGRDMIVSPAADWSQFDLFYEAFSDDPEDIREAGIEGVQEIIRYANELTKSHHALLQKAREG